VGVGLAVSTGLEGRGRWVAILALGLLLVSFLTTLGAFAAQAYARSPGPEDLWHYADRPLDELRLLFLSTRFHAIESNRARLEAKARRLSVGLILFGGVGLAAGLIAIGRLVP
jgi:hypothetical protein